MSYLNQLKSHLKDIFKKIEIIVNMLTEASVYWAYWNCVIDIHAHGDESCSTGNELALLTSAERFKLRALAIRP